VDPVNRPPVRVSAIVCNLNGGKFLPRLIETLRGQRGVCTEIIVVDRESTDGSREYMAGFPDINVVTEPAATGLVAGYHAGFEAATGDLIFFCNEDLWLDEHCLARLAAHISLEDRIGAADPWQWSYDGARHIRAGMRFHRAFLDRISCYPPRGFDFLVPLQSGDAVAFASGGAVLVHRRMYVGGWDTSFFLEFEEPDFFLRAWQRGWRCVTEPAAKVYHAVGMSTYQAGPPPATVLRRRRVGGESNRAVICLKHFTGPGVAWGLFVLLRPLVAHALHLRVREARLYVDALRLTAARLPGVLRFRAANRALRRARPGQEFFTAPDLQRANP
jgi:GT2 family glycosyltransferase